jgi:cytochrome c-type biogenesis protein
MRRKIMESLFAIVQQWISSGGIGLAAAGSFVGGALTAMNPCVLVMVPLLIGFIGGMDENITTWKSFLLTLVFIIGFSVELAVLFTVGLAAAPFLQSEYMVYVVALICVLLGLHFMDIFHIQLPISQDKLPKYTGFLGAALFGFMFGLVSLPCTGPALLLIVSVIPLKGAVFGGVMMLFYGVGHCLLILAVGTSAGAARHLISSARMHAANLVLKKAAGALLAAVGLYLGAGALFPAVGLAF